MGVGQIISDTFGTVKERFGALLGVWAIYFAISIALSIAFVVGIGITGVAGIAAMQSNPLAVGGGMILTIVVFYIGYLMVVMAQYASLIAVASPLRQANVGDALGTGLRAAPALLLLMIVMILGYLAVGIVLSIVGAIFSTMGQWASAVFVLLLVLLMLWLGSRLAPLFAVIAVDGVRNPITAITRSWRLTSGHALNIFLASLVFLLLVIVVCGVALLPSIGLLVSMANPADLAGAAPPALGGMLLLMLGIVVASVLINIGYCAFMAVIHGLASTAAGEGAVEAFA